MLKASEAWALTKKYDKYAEQLEMIEQEIKKAAEQGESVTWWHCENMIFYEREELVKRLNEFGYVVHDGGNVIYINWRGKND